MKYQYWRCSICQLEWKTDTQGSYFDLLSHIESHPKEFGEMKENKNMYVEEERKISEKFRKMNLGFWFKNITPPVKRKLWKCPKCFQEMGYHHKYHHQANATKNGEPYMCKPEENKKVV